MGISLGKVLLADDHALVRDGVGHLLQLRGWNPQILEAGNLSQVQETIRAHTDLDLILLDLMMPGMDGIASIRWVRHAAPLTPLIILTMSDSLTHGEECMRAGVNGYIPKSSTSELMLSAIEVVMNGGIYFPPQFIAATRGRHTPAQPPAPVQLTERQRDVLRLMVLGKTNKEIARSLEISDVTVKSHLTALFRQLEASNRTEAVHRARHLGLINPLPNGNF